MKKFLLIFILLTVSLFAGEKRVKLFPFKSAVITYKYEASFSGTHIKYIADYGYKQSDYIRKTEKFGGNADTEFETIIRIGPKAYTINYQDSTVAVGRNATYGYYLLNEDRTCNEVSEALLKAASGWKLSGTERYLQKDCKRWKSGSNTLLTWKGLELKSVINFMTMMVEKAVKLEINVDVPQNKFEIPQGFRYISGDVYQGFSGLKLRIDSTETRTDGDGKHIKISFSTADLESCNNFIYYTDKGKEVYTQGVNDYNKIDRLIIQSQEQQLSENQCELPPAGTLIFKTNDNHWGKMQIKQIDKNGYEVRYAVFNDDGTILKFSDGSGDFLKNDFNLAVDDSQYKLIITPKDSAICSVLDW